MTCPDYFLDTNLLIYATSLAADHAAKKPRARAWVARTDWGISTQVLMEFYAQARQPRHGLLPTAAEDFVRALVATRPVQPVDAPLVLEALRLRNRYYLSHWDAAILVAARLLGARYVISEDIAHGESFDGVTVINPFLEPAA